MEPIISPWLIWWLQTCDTIKTFCCVGAALSGVALLISLILYIYSILEYNDEEMKTELVPRLIKKGRNISLFLLVSLMSLGILIPDKATAKWMVVSSYVTEENIDTAVENTKEAIDYIFDKIEGLTNENNNQTS